MESASVKSICSLLICVMMVALVSHAKTIENSHMDDKKNGLRTDGLQAIYIKERDVYLSNLWELYKSSKSSEKPEVAKEIRDALTQVAYLDSRIHMLGFFLFGPKYHKSILRSVRDKKRPLVDDQQCLESTLKLFEKHCGCLTERSMKQSMANICNYMADKGAIEEAIIITCGMHKTESHGIDMRNPKVDVTPAPIKGTFEYCGRAHVKGVSRMRLWSYAKVYHVTVVPSDLIYDRWHNLIQVCFHRNDSQGLCQCEKDDWRSLQQGSWSSVMTPFEQRFVDVKFVVGLQGFVTVTINEVSQGWRYGLLTGGVALLFMAVSKWVPFSSSMVVKWATPVFAVTCICMSSIDTLLAAVAVCYSLVLCYLLTSIIALIVRKKTKLWPRSGLRQGTVNALGNGGTKGIQNDYYSTFHTFQIRKKLSAKELTGQFVAELASSPDFEEWMINNAHRIRLRPKNG